MATFQRVSVTSCKLTWLRKAHEKCCRNRNLRTWWRSRVASPTTRYSRTPVKTWRLWRHHNTPTELHTSSRRHRQRLQLRRTQREAEVRSCRSLDLRESGATRTQEATPGNLFSTNACLALSKTLIPTIAVVSSWVTPCKGKRTTMTFQQVGVRHNLATHLLQVLCL